MPVEPAQAHAVPLSGPIYAPGVRAHREEPGPGEYAPVDVNITRRSMTSGRAVFGTASRFHKAQKQAWADRTAEAKPYSDALVGPKAPAFTIGVRREILGEEGEGADTAYEVESALRAVEPSVSRGGAIMPAAQSREPYAVVEACHVGEGLQTWVVRKLQVAMNCAERAIQAGGVVVLAQGGWKVSGITVDYKVQEGDTVYLTEGAQGGGWVDELNPRHELRSHVSQHHGLWMGPVPVEHQKPWEPHMYRGPEGDRLRLPRDPSESARLSPRAHAIPRARSAERRSRIPDGDRLTLHPEPSLVQPRVLAARILPLHQTVAREVPQDDEDEEQPSREDPRWDLAVDTLRSRPRSAMIMPEHTQLHRTTPSRRRGPPGDRLVLDPDLDAVRKHIPAALILPEKGAPVQKDMTNQPVFLRKGQNLSYEWLGDQTLPYGERMEELCRVWVENATQEAEIAGAKSAANAEQELAARLAAFTRDADALDELLDDVIEREEDGVTSLADPGTASQEKTSVRYAESGEVCEGDEAIVLHSNETHSDSRIVPDHQKQEGSMDMSSLWSQLDALESMYDVAEGVHGTGAEDLHEDSPARNSTVVISGADMEEGVGERSWGNSMLVSAALDHMDQMVAAQSHSTK